MKTRGQLYRQEAASLLRDISMYKALREGQLLRLYPEQGEKIPGLLAYLEKQQRIQHVGNVYCVDPDEAGSVDWGLLAAVWVLVDFIDRVEYHCVGEFPAKVIFIAAGEVYEIIYMEPGKETLLSQVIRQKGDEDSRYLILVDDPGQIEGLDLPHACGYCTVSPDGEVQYYQKD